MKITDLVNEPLIGGTLVEYEAGSGFFVEFDRAKIIHIGFKSDRPNFFMIDTDNTNAMMGIDLDYFGNETVYKREDGAIFWESVMGWCYAVFPQGVEIPIASRELNESFTDLARSEYEKSA